MLTTSAFGDVLDRRNELIDVFAVCGEYDLWPDECEQLQRRDFNRLSEYLLHGIVEFVAMFES